MTTLTANKTIQFEQVMKLFKNYVSKSEVMPVLQHVYYGQDGYLYGTNSHHLLRVNTKYITDIPENYIIGSLYDPKKNEIVQQEMSYPACERLIPNYYNSTVELHNSNVKELLKHIKTASQIVKSKKNNAIAIHVNNTNTKIFAYDLEKDMSEKYITELVYTMDEEFSFHVNAKYVQDALMTVKKLSTLSYNNAEMQFIDRLRPFQFVQDDIFNIIVLPVRIH